MRQRDRRIEREYGKERKKRKNWIYEEKEI